MQRFLSLIVMMGFASVLSTQQAWSQLGGGRPRHDQRVKDFLDRNEIKYEIDNDGDFRILYEVGDGRSQIAIIMSSTNIYRNFEIREIWSPAYRSEQESIPEPIANRLLEDTSAKKLGAWEKAGKLAVFVVKIAADADDESLISALQVTLTTADEMEQELTGDDAF